MATILIIDDEEDLLEICQIVLNSAGYEIVTLTAPERALALAKQWRPDLILLDIIMPEVNGEQILQLLRAEPETAAIPVVMMSALEDGSSRSQALHADGFLAKPFECEELLRTVARAIGTRAKQPGCAAGSCRT